LDEKRKMNMKRMLNKRMLGCCKCGVATKIVNYFATSFLL
jgi:hypothetical protein